MRSGELAGHPNFRREALASSHYILCTLVVNNSKKSPQSDPKSGQLYLWLAVVILGASGAVTRKITEIGAQNFAEGQNPISWCNVLFVGNLCALLVLVVLHRRQWNRSELRRLSRWDWTNLVFVTLLSGAIAPALVFQALALTQVNNVILIGRLGAPLTLVLSIWLLQERVSRWELIGAAVALVGVMMTILLQSPAPTLPLMQVGTAKIGIGELLSALGAIAAAVSTIVVKKHLSHVPLGIYSVFRNAVGTVVFFCVVLILYGSQHFMGVFSPFLWQWMVVYGVVIVVLGQSFWLRGLRASTVVTSSAVSSFMPIVGILAAYWILNETPTQAQYIGGGIVLVGLLLSQIGIYQNSHKRLNPRSSLQVEQIKLDTGMGFKGV